MNVAAEKEGGRERGSGAAANITGSVTNLIYWFKQNQSLCNEASPLGFVSDCTI